jgi:hypothetical protein
VCFVAARVRKTLGVRPKMRNIPKYIFLLASLLLSAEVFSLSCSGVAEEFYFSCRDSVCTPEFQVSFKKTGGACARRPIVIDVSEGVGSYFSSSVTNISSPDDGIYKLVILFRYWRYKPSTEIERLKSTLSEEYGYLLLNPETGKKLTVLNIEDLLSKSISGVSFEFIASLENTMIQKIKKEKITEQYSGLAKYSIYILVYWGTFVLCLSALVYSVNRFYYGLNLSSKIDKRSFAIQFMVLILSSLSFILMSWDPWVGVLLLPAVVVVLIAEIWAALRKRYEKA